MIRLLISNQRGGVGKTTTVITLSRYLVDEGRRVLLIDTDPQGSIETVLGVKASHHLAHFVAHRYALSECIVRVSERLDVLCSNRETLQAEAALMGAQAREVVLQHLLERWKRITTQSSSTRHRPFRFCKRALCSMRGMSDSGGYGFAFRDRRRRHDHGRESIE